VLGGAFSQEVLASIAGELQEIVGADDDVSEEEQAFVDAVIERWQVEPRRRRRRGRGRRGRGAKRTTRTTKTRTRKATTKRKNEKERVAASAGEGTLASRALPRQASASSSWRTARVVSIKRPSMTKEASSRRQRATLTLKAEPLRSVASGRDPGAEGMVERRVMRSPTRSTSSASPPFCQRIGAALTSASRWSSRPAPRARPRVPSPSPACRRPSCPWPSRARPSRDLP
jgi:hypothetical protein